MNVTSAYTKEINKINLNIKNLEDRKAKLPVLSTVLNATIEKLKVKKKELEDELKVETDIVDAYIENIMSNHNSLKHKLRM